MAGRSASSGLLRLGRAPIVNQVMTVKEAHRAKEATLNEVPPYGPGALLVGDGQPSPLTLLQRKSPTRVEDDLLKMLGVDDIVREGHLPSGGLLSPHLPKPLPSASGVASLRPMSGASRSSRSTLSSVAEESQMEARRLLARVEKVDGPAGSCRGNYMGSLPPSSKLRAAHLSTGLGPPPGRAAPLRPMSAPGWSRPYTPQDYYTTRSPAQVRPLFSPGSTW